MGMAARVVPLVPDGTADLQRWMWRDGLPSPDIVAQPHGSVHQPPPDYPTSAKGSMAWSGTDFAGLHVVKLDEADNVEVGRGLKFFHALELDGDEVSRERFPLPLLGSRLEECALEVHRGSGLCIIRGLATERYSVEDSTIIFLGIASYIGGQRGVQSSKGAMLSHVTESKSWTVPRGKRHGIHTNNSLPFHNDMGCEILTMQVRGCAATGGHTCVASLGSVYDELMRTSPWVVHALAKPNWPVQVSREDSSPYILSPLLEFHSGNLMMSMDPARLGPHPAAPHGMVPPLTPEQKEALELVQLAARKHQFRLQTRPGDLVFLNNWSLLHGREAYEDGVGSSRHLVRLWLRHEKLGWNIPASMRMPWDTAFGERSKQVVNRQYPIVPMPRYMEPKYGNGTAAFVAEDDDGDEEN